MKTYLIVSDTNYGVGVHVVNAEDPKAALEAAERTHFCPWPGAEVLEVETTKPGVQHVVTPTGG